MRSEGAYELFKKFCIQDNNFLLIKFFKKIISDGSLLEKISKNSYLHQNNFIKLVLEDERMDGFKLRLHIWNKETVNSLMCNYHNHRWNFESKIIFGTIQETIYTFKKHKKGKYYSYKFWNDHSSNKGNIDFIARSNLKPENVLVYQQNHHYKRDHSTIHTIEPITTYAATLVLQHPECRNFSEVFLYKENVPSKETKYEKINSNFVKLTLINLISKISNPELSINDKKRINNQTLIKNTL